MKRFDFTGKYKVYRYADFSFGIKNFRDSDGNAIDVSGGTFKCHVRKKDDLTIGVPLIEVNGVYSSGKVRFQFDYDKMKTLAPEIYEYDVKYTENSFESIILGGNIEFDTAVTR